MRVVLLRDKVLMHQVLEAEEKHTAPTAGSGRATKMSEHLGTLKKVEIRLMEPNFQEAQELDVLVLQHGKCHSPSVHAISDHLSNMREKAIARSAFKENIVVPAGSAN